MNSKIDYIKTLIEFNKKSHEASKLGIDTINFCEKLEGGYFDLVCELLGLNNNNIDRLSNFIYDKPEVVIITKTDSIKNFDSKDFNNKLKTKFEYRITKIETLLKYFEECK